MAKGDKIGASLLINNEIYPEGEATCLTGSYVDIRRVKAVLDQVGFKRHDSENIEQMSVPVDIDSEYCERPDHYVEYEKDSTFLYQAVRDFCNNCNKRMLEKSGKYANKMAVVYITSHGREEFIVNTEPALVAKKTIIEILSECEALKDKPVIIIVDACRSGKSWWTRTKEFFKKNKLPKNILLCLACKSNMPSWGGSMRGGRYTRELTSMLCKYATDKNMSIIDILDEVEKNMIGENEANDWGKGLPDDDNPWLQVPVYYADDIGYWKKFKFSDHYDI